LHLKKNNRYMLMFDVKIDKLQSSFLRTLKYKIIKCNMWNKLIYYNILCYDIHIKTH